MAALGAEFGTGRRLDTARGTRLLERHFLSAVGAELCAARDMGAARTHHIGRSH